jgi:replicative DNA helicase
MTDAVPPPQSMADEEAILSEILDHAVAIRGCIEAGLEPEHFYRTDFGRIYRAMRQAAAEGHHADEATTWATLQRLGFAAPAEEGIERLTLAALTNRSANPFGVSTRAHRVIALANERASLEGAHRVIEGVREPEAKRKAELLQEGLELIAADFTVDAQPTSRQELHSDFFDYLDKEEPAEVFELPWADLNECVLGGYRRQQTSVLAAWSGFGKSWALDQMLGAFHGQGKTTAIFATEMSRRERIARFITTKTGVPVENLLLKKLSAEQMAAAVKALESIPFDYFEVSGWTEDRICERIVFGNYDVAAVDVLNLIPGYEEKTAYASRIVGRFMNLAQRANCHIILVSHLNNERAKAAVKPRPVKRDLRQTGMLESNAHQILFLHRDQDDDGQLRDTGEIFFAKVRNGMEGKVNVTHNQKFLTFQRRAFTPPDEKPDKFFEQMDRGRAA